jgi:eukaryotic-like serine/threonine-protein kinase
MINWLPPFVRRLNPAGHSAQGRMKFGNSSAGRSVSRTGLLLKKQLWVWPIFAVVVLAGIGYGIHVAIERTMQASLQSQLTTLLNVQRSMLETWLHIQESNAQSLANDSQVRELAAQLIAATPPAASSARGKVSESSPSASPNLSSLQSRVTQELAAGMSAHNFIRYILVNKEHCIVAASSPELLGRTIPEYESFLSRALDGQVTVSAPFPSVVVMADEHERTRTGVATMFVVAPIFDANQKVIAALGLRIRPEREFTQILQMGRMGQTGETYAINKDGLLVSNSRFDDQLARIGLLPDTADAQSILNISLRDPGGDMTTGFRPKVRRVEQPLNRIGAAALKGNSGVVMECYNDYRGRPSVGAYTWLPKYEMGIITEIDHAEAYRPLTILHWAFLSIFGLLALSSVAIFVFTLVVARLGRQAQKAALEAKRLGQYQLEEKLGAGGMGVVYKGHHAMLRRPTAIKMLNPDMVNDLSISRFEREVQTTCKLNNPSTIAIYDYGRTPEGVFYYAMEYLDGLDLLQLVERFGPQPEGRVIHILHGVCASLAEAHGLGLVHRDIKPANVMLNRRGGGADVVKVLDFGLVRAVDETKITMQSGTMAGTPLYMSPEAIQSPDRVDARSDIYSIGALGYFLLTGQPVFAATTLLEVCHDHVHTAPMLPSVRLGKPVSPELEAALLACLEKSRDHRPQSTRELAALLDRASTAGSWTVHDANSWWIDHERSQLPEPTDLASTASFAQTSPNSRDRTFSSNPKGTLVIDAGDHLIGIP